MAKTSMIAREHKRAKTVARFADKRAALKKVMMDTSATPEDRRDASRKFHALPRDSSPVRQRNRCRITGRPHGYYRKFGICRNMLREAVMNGEVPGVRKASW